MRISVIVLMISFVSFAGSASAGSKQLVVAFFDFSNGVGKTSFKTLRSNKIEHSCWHESFVEISGIETAYIENVPRALQGQDLRQASLGDPVAAERFRQSLQASGLDGAYAFVLDPSGRYGVVHGMGYQSISVTSSASMAIPDKGIIPSNILSKRLCEASKAMD